MGSNCVKLPHFVSTAQSVTEIWRVFDFFQDGGRWCACLNRPRRAFGGLYHCAKFGWNRYSSFDNVQVLIFCDLSLKTPIHATKLECRGYDP